MPKSFSARMFVALIVISGLLLFLGMPYLTPSPCLQCVCSFSVGCLLGSKAQDKASGSNRNNVSKFALHPCGSGGNELQLKHWPWVSSAHSFNALPRARSSKLVQAAFNCSTITLAVAATQIDLMLRLRWLRWSVRPHCGWRLRRQDMRWQTPCR